ncbi:MAG: hypothetical protein HC819_00750 [Cyclobacteriaceae bacterium]|nr:hypothetical protein [Cyclobacteriaceae bacterium]
MARSQIPGNLFIKIAKKKIGHAFHLEAGFGCVCPQWPQKHQITKI